MNFRAKWKAELPKIISDSDVNGDWLAFTNYIADIEQADIDVVLDQVYFMLHVDRCPSAYLSSLAYLVNADLSGAVDDNARRLIISTAFQANVQSITTAGFIAVLANIAVGAAPQILSHWQRGYWSFTGNNARSLVDNLTPANVRKDDQFNKGGLVFPGRISAHNLFLILVDPQTTAVYDSLKTKVAEIKAAHHVHWIVTAAIGGGYVRQREVV